MKKDSNYIYGRNAIIQALESGSVEKVFLSYSTHGSAINRIFSLCKKNDVPITKYDKKRFIKLEKDVCPQPNSSQGVIAQSKIIETIDINLLIKQAYEQSEAPVIVALDEITDPQNFGAIARSAECAGTAGIIIQDRNSAPINAAAVKASAGALEKIPVSRVTNLSDTLEKLKEEKFWIVGTEMEAEQNYTAEIYETPTVLVIGSEGKGMRYRTTKVCDHLVSIPMKGKTQSLNASVSTGILLFEILRQRATNNIQND